MAELIIRMSRCAPPTLYERWQNRSLIDYSAWICRSTHCPFSHGDLRLDNGYLLGASDNKFAPIVTGNPRGVAIRPVEYQRFAIRRDLVFKTTDQIKKDFTDFCIAQIPKPFDTEALMFSTFFSGDFANRDWRAEDKWFCYEMLGRAAEVSGLIDWPYPGIKNRMTGGDFLIWVASKMDFNRFFQPIPGLPRAGPWEY
jgi:hypothetical protein